MRCVALTASRNLQLGYDLDAFKAGRVRKDEDVTNPAEVQRSRAVNISSHVDREACSCSNVLLYKQSGSDGCRGLPLPTHSLSKLRSFTNTIAILGRYTSVVGLQQILSIDVVVFLSNVGLPLLSRRSVVR